MKTTRGAYTFQAVEAEDLPLLARWLNDLQVLRWYDDPDYIDTLEDQLEESRVRMQLVLHEGAPIAYVQDYDIHGWPDHHLAYLPQGSRGMDTFIGRGEWMGAGHGTRYLRQLCAQLFTEGAPALGIDPHPDNAQALRAYQKIGFAEDGRVASQWGDVVLMSCHAPVTSA